MGCDFVYFFEYFLSNFEDVYLNIFQSTRGIQLQLLLLTPSRATYYLLIICIYRTMLSFMYEHFSLTFFSIPGVLNIFGLNSTATLIYSIYRQKHFKPVFERPLFFIIIRNYHAPYVSFPKYDFKIYLFSRFFFFSYFGKLNRTHLIWKTVTFLWSRQLGLPSCLGDGDFLES